MKIALQRPNLFSRTKRRKIADRFREVGVLSLCALLLVTPEMQAAKPGGVAVLLPPFVPVLPPTPFLFPESPFAMTGFMQSATVDRPSDPLSSGSFVMNGITITVPAYTILQMPAAAMTWQELFYNAPTVYKNQNQTGLALSDNPKPLMTYEITVNGNRVIKNGGCPANTPCPNDQYVAGLIFISQQSLNTAQGYINAIDYSRVASGGPVEILVSKKLFDTTGSARIRLNTPTGRYGVPDPNADIRFTSDEDNPTIIARDGYPMCLPRFDPNPAPPAVGVIDSLCPQWNRPRDGYTGAYSTNYTMPAATAGAPTPPAVPGGLPITHRLGYPAPPTAVGGVVPPDPFEQAPFEVGDYLTYIGTLTADPVIKSGTLATDPANFYISAHTVVADLAIQTAPGTWPVYTTIEDLRIFVGGVRNPIFPLEGQEKIFGDAFSTDYSQLVDIYAVDVNPVTGARTHRFYMSSDPFGPPLGGLRGRARFRATIGNFLPATREMAAVSRSLTGGQPVDNVIAIPRYTANGVQAGIFQAPQFTFIFPENLVIGSQQIPLTFEQFPFLVNGSGPYVPFGAPQVAGPILQITPFPSMSPPLAGTTMFQPPTANAGSPQTVPSGAPVTLDGGASTDPAGQQLIYTWIQSAGLSVSTTLASADQQKPTFVAPTLAAGATPAVLTFQLAVCNSFTCGGIATVNVTVLPPVAVTPPSVTLSVDKPNPGPGALVTLTSIATGGGNGSPGGPGYTYAFTQTAGPAQNGFATGGNTATFTATPGATTPTTLTFQCTVTDNAASKTTATINVYVGSDTITPTNVVYSLSKSRLQIAMTDNALPKGAAIITATPLVNGVPISAGIIATYDPGIDGYNILAAIVNPIPDSVRLTSNYGASIVTPITRIR